MNQTKLIKPLLILTSIIILITIVSSVLVFTDTNSKLATKTQQKLIIGIFPRRNIPTTISMFSPLAKYIEAKIGFL